MLALIVTHAPLCVLLMPGPSACSIAPQGRIPDQHSLACSDSKTMVWDTKGDGTWLLRIKLILLTVANGESTG